MLDRIKQAAFRKVYQVAKKKGVGCPDCKQKLDLPSETPNDLFAATFSCSSCGWSGGAEDILMDGQDDAHTQLEHCEQPEDSRIQKETRNGAQLWFIPKRGFHINFFLVFALFWLGITSVVSLGILFGEPSQDSDEMPIWAAIPFFGVFWAVGIGMLYAALKSMFARYLIVLDAKQLSLTSQMFGKGKTTSLQRDQIQEISQKVFYQKNYQPVYGIEIREQQRKRKIRFGSFLSDADKAWFVSELKQSVGIKKEVSVANTVAAYSSGRLDVASLSTKRLSLKPQGKASFTLSVKAANPLVPFLIGFVTLLVSVFLFQTAFNEFGDLGDREDSIFNLIDALFSVIPGLIGIAFFATSMICFGLSFRWRGRKKRFEFGEDALTVTTITPSNRKSVRYEKSEITKVVRRGNGHVNNEPRYAVTLHIKGKKNIKLCSWNPREEANTIKAAADHWLAA